MYAIGVDLGTVYTAAAAWRDGLVEIVTLGGRTATIPSVVLWREDQTFLVGDAANRRGLLEPSRVAREFKRRFGDSTPIILGGTPHSAEALMARLLRSVVEEVAGQQGGPPERLCLCHPANWGPYKTDLLQQAVRLADLDVPVTLVVEPVAAAAHYAQQQRVEDGALIAVYDLGGGTFDAAVVRKAGDGFELLGHPEGIDHLGGADFDAAVFEHVRGVVGDPLSSLDDDSPAAVAAVSRLREECTAAKELLSSDTDVSIPVLLPQHTTEVRLTRAELERMIRPALYDTIAALQRAVRSAGVSASDLHSVLLIGGSSRIPLVAQLVGSELDRPVAVDAHPKHVVALGAALVAGTGLPAGVTARVPAQAPPAAPVADATDAPEAIPAPVAPPPVAPEPAVPEPAVPEPVTPAPVAPEPATPDLTGPDAVPLPAPRPPAPGPSRRPWLVAALATAAVVVAVAAFVVLRPRGGAPAAAVGSRSTAATSATGATSATTAASSSPDPLLACPRTTAVFWACLGTASVSGTHITFGLTENFTPSAVQDRAHYHFHLYLANRAGPGTTDPAETLMQVGAVEGSWYNVYDAQVTTLDGAEPGGHARLPADPKGFTLLCVRVASGLHGLAPDRNGGFRTGNCVPMAR